MIGQLIAFLPASDLDDTRQLITRTGPRVDIDHSKRHYSTLTEILWDVSGQLGHAKGESAPTTENYAKFDPDYLAKAKSAFEA